MTYDYAMNSGPQPNSPLPWLEQQFKVIFGPDGASAAGAVDAGGGARLPGMTHRKQRCLAVARAL